MANDLENLNEKMNRSVLKDIRFEERHKKHVMKTIKQSSKGPRKSRSIWTRKVNAGLSIGVSAALIAGVIYYGSDRMGLIPSNEQPSHQADKHHTNPPNDPKDTMSTQKLDPDTRQDQIGIDPLKKVKNSDSIYEPPKQKEYYGDMTTKEVVTKMYNSGDHFKTAKGKFEMMVTLSSKPVTTEVEYQISLGEPIGGYTKVMSDSTYGPTMKYSFFKEGTVWEIFQDTNEYRKGTYNTGMDQIPPVELASTTLYPYTTSLFFVKDNHSWVIEKQNEELLGHNTIVVTGNMNNLSGEKFRSKTFRFWVDKDSGILVQFETYDDSGAIVNYLHPIELEVNVPVDTSLFEPNLEGYENQGNTNPEYDPRERMVTQKAFAKGYDKDSLKEINSVLERMRNEIPELYELKDQSVQPTLVDYEAYRELIPQGALMYVDKKSYNSGDPAYKTFYVRFQDEKAYHKNEYEYVVKTGDPLDRFKLNGIRWEVRKDDRNIYYIGKKGDYTYEIVAEHYTLEEANKLLKTFKPSK